jgi:hypothetical protein
VGLGLPEHEIKRYSELLRTDGVVVSVTTSDKKVAQVAERTLEQAGALDTRTASGMTAHV